ncbi:MAG: phosphoserine phosphatase SerB [Alphaproteobacteria bacterium]
MHHVITIVAAPEAVPALPDTARSFRSTIESVQPIEWLADHACDIFFEPKNQDTLKDIREAVHNTLADVPADAFIQPVAKRRKRMLVADMDSTIIGQESLDEIADAVGIGPQITAITERAMRGEMDFETALKERIELLKGFPEAKLQSILDERITLNPGAETLLATMLKNNARAVLVSGGFTLFTQAIAERLGFDAHYGNRFIMEDGAITGVAEPILGQDAKLATLRQEAADNGIDLTEVIAVGDGANDLSMLKAAGVGVAYHAKPIVACEAAARINHGDLTTLLYFQGYRQDEFVTPNK